MSLDDDNKFGFNGLPYSMDIKNDFSHNFFLTRKTNKPSICHESFFCLSFHNNFDGKFDLMADTRKGEVHQSAFGWAIRSKYEIEGQRVHLLVEN